MRKLILTIGIMLITTMVFSQATNTRVVRIADATTAWGENLPKGTYIYDLDSKSLYVLDSSSVLTKTLTTETNKTLINVASTDDQNLTWDAVNGHVEIEGGNDADIGLFGTTTENYGFVKGSNGETTKFLRGDGTWQTVITANVDVYTKITHWDEVATDDLTPPYPITLSQTPAAGTKITVQINGTPIKYAVGTTNGTFNFTGTTLNIYSNVYQYDQIEVDYEY